MVGVQDEPPQPAACRTRIGPREGEAFGPERPAHLRPRRTGDPHHRVLPGLPPEVQVVPQPGSAGHRPGLVPTAWPDRFRHPGRRGQRPGVLRGHARRPHAERGRTAGAEPRGAGRAARGRQGRRASRGRRDRGGCPLAGLRGRPVPGGPVPVRPEGRRQPGPAPGTHGPRRTPDRGQPPAPGPHRRQRPGADVRGPRAERHAGEPPGDRRAADVHRPLRNRVDALLQPARKQGPNFAPAPAAAGHQHGGKPAGPPGRGGCLRVAGDPGTHHRHRRGEAARGLHAAGAGPAPGHPRRRLRGVHRVRRTEDDLLQAA